MKRILVIHGPNINLTGWREPEIYGDTTFSDIQDNIVKLGKELGFVCENFQSNHEGEIIDKIHAAREVYDGMIINPGAYTHYSYAIHDAISAVEIETVEVHMSNIFDRESFREKSVTASACEGTICGFGENSYYLALYALQRILE
ncbi:3-dehydroquinate dehydratase [Clostridia bacterium]|nr:3-dehydroquinate dehydratase [Clostridia bacterium]